MSAFAIRVGHPLVRTFANHRSNGQGIKNTASGSTGARSQFNAWINAFVIDASHFVGTINILVADWLLPCLTEGEWITFGCVFGTAAVWFVITNETDGVLGAWWIIISGAWVDALLVDAGTLIGAVVVGVALDGTALLEWIAFETFWASTGGTVVVAVAFGVDGALIVNTAWINAFPVVALHLRAALVVRLATNLITTKLGITGVARTACADGVMILNATIGIGATVAWVDAEFVDARFRRSAVGVRTAARRIMVGCRKIYI